MIAGATVEGFRGLRRLEVDGFGRVNLIVGKNGHGKTALMEALAIAAGAEGVQHADAACASPVWTMKVWSTDGGERVVADATGPSPGPEHASGGPWWVGRNKSTGSDESRLFSKIEQDGHAAQFMELLREVDGRISGIENQPSTGLLVRYEPNAQLLPVAAMGGAFQRCFEIGVGAMTLGSLFIDGLDNSLHHAILEPIWRWLAVISSKRNVQVFATTHSQECIHAASRAFSALDDDGLRVIRLDRHEDRTTAAIYDRTLVETAAETGVEIRG